MADCKRKTANLFDGNYTVAVMSVSGNTATLNTASSGRTAIVECEPNTTYTVRKYGVSNRFIIAESDIKPVNGTAMSIIRNDSSKSEYIFTTSNTTQYVAIYCSTSSEQAEPQLMLNIGSTALPYEPYGWVHSLRKLSTDTDTITTLPADIYPNDTTATVGLKGQAVQSSTPSPDNPIMLQGTGERTINLFNKNDVENKIVSKEGVENISNYYILSTFISVDNGVTVSATKLLTDPIRIIRYDANKQFISRTDENTANNIVVDDCAYIRINANKDHWDINTIQVEYGRTATPYEPYGIKIPISSANTTTPVYLGEVESTRRIKKLVLDGTENWKLSSATNIFYIDSVLNAIPQVAPTCTHFEGVNTFSADNQIVISASKKMNIRTTYIQHNLTDWINYLQQQYAAGTPVTVWYVLATEETAVVNEPLMRIGDYADAVSNVSIPVTAGGDTLSVDTTVQPSGVTVNYNGWHPVQSVHEKSRNLFDKSSNVVEYYIASNNGAWTQTVSTSRSLLIKCEPNTTYTIFVPTNRTLRAVYFNDFPSVGDLGYGLTDDTTENYVNKTLTITTGSSAQYLAFFCYNSSQEATMYDEAEYFSQIMLNEGSTALPYEPYWK